MELVAAFPKELEPALRARLDDEDRVVRLQARQAMIRLGIPEAERDAIIGAMLESPDDHERLAAEWLVQLGKPERAIPVLKELAGRGDPILRGRARWSLSLVDLGKEEP